MGFKTSKFARLIDLLLINIIEAKGKPCPYSSCFKLYFKEKIMPKTVAS